MTTHVVLCGHGTRYEDGAAQFVQVAKAVQESLPGLVVRPAFLELSAPLLTEALDALHAEGARSAAVVPVMLFAAGHAKTDIPDLMRGWLDAHPDAMLRYGRALGLAPSMLDAARARIEEGLAAAPAGPPLEESLLLVIGRGCSDPDANADLAKAARLLWEGMGFGLAATAYFDVTFPTIPAAFDQAAKLGYRRVVVLPWLLFKGQLTRDLARHVAGAAGRHPHLDIVVAPTLNDHAGVVATLAERAEEAARGEGDAPCLMCKYRTPILAFEAGSETHPFPGHPLGPNRG